MEQKQKQVNTLRLLSVEQIEKANSGHPGMALGAAPIVFVLYDSIMKYNAKNPKWINRDRFILSAGHASALLYSALHMFGYEVTKEDLKNFRRIGSNTPGHPEHQLTPGVEASTGPLGQGVANSVGMAIAQKHLASTFNTKEINILDNQIFCLASDGCFMEGVALEALSLAGSLGLDNLNIIYDSNQITIDGSTSLTFIEDTAKKFEAMGFFVQEVKDGNDLFDLEQKLLKAKNTSFKPTLTIVHTKIGYGSLLEGTNTVHGQPLNKEQIKELKKNLSLEKESFEIPSDIKELLNIKYIENQKLEKVWEEKLDKYKKNHPGKFGDFIKYFEGGYKTRAIQKLKKLEAKEGLALRDIGHLLLQELKVLLPNLLGGTADVAPSTKAYLADFAAFSGQNPNGRNLHFGVREHAMSAICNGMLLYGGVEVFASTYLIFSDYMKAGMRMSALMDLPLLYYMTHDSVLIGQDGATHQSCEQLLSLRATPNMTVFRPCNFEEVLAGYITWLEGRGPLSLVLSKSKINSKPTLLKNALKGGYVLSEEKGKLKLILIATGTEVEQALLAQEILQIEGIATRVVSLPSFEVFDRQADSYKNKVLPRSISKRIAIEGGSKYSFYKYVGSKGHIISVDEFGHSGTPQELGAKFNLTAEHLVEVAKNILIFFKKDV